MKNQDQAAQTRPSMNQTPLPMTPRPSAPLGLPKHPNVREDAGVNGRQRVRTLWISDLHLGARHAKSAELLAFLDTVEFDTLYLVGDILDFWKLRRKVRWTRSETALVAHVARLAQGGVNVVYVPGNHDAEFRGHGIFQLAGVGVRDEIVHHTADGRRLLVTHGDRFDDLGETSPWLVALGDRAYEAATYASDALSTVGRWLGREDWSLSMWIKQRVKARVGMVSRFEECVAEAARERRVDGVVCGHIHNAELREIDGVLYANDGDWVESCTALVEHLGGRLELQQWDGSKANPIAEHVGSKSGVRAAPSKRCEAQPA